VKTKRNSAMWEYLSTSGVLEKGDALAITEAKKEWRRLRDKERKRKERTGKHEHVISLSPDDETRIKNVAKQHGLSESEMIRRAAFAYLEQAYILPDVVKLYHVEALMKRTLTSIELIAAKDKSWLAGQRNYSELKESVQSLYKVVKEEYSKPRPIDALIIQMAKDSPAFRTRILNLLR